MRPEGEGNLVTRGLAVQDTTEPGVTVSRSYYGRLRQRVLDLGSEQSSNWVAAMWSFWSVGASAALAAIVLSHDDKTQLGPAVPAVLWSILVGGVICGLICLIAHKSRGAQRKDEAQDIAAEMDMHGQE